MGNVHSIVQTAPLVSIEGAALPVRPRASAAFVARMAHAKLPSYVTWHRAVPAFTIYNVNVFSSDVVDEGRASVYLVLNGGGKWGYDDDWRALLDELAPMLEDATFFLGDEYTSYIDRYEIAAGIVAVTREVGQDGVMIDHVESELRGDPLRYLTFCLDQARSWMSLDEPDGALPWIDKAIAIDPASWEPHLERALILGAHGGHVEAIASLERARACLGPYTLKPWGAPETEPLVMVENDPSERVSGALQRIECVLGDQLASLGRLDEAFAAWDRSYAITPRRTNAAPMTNKAARLVALGRFDEAARCLAQAMRLAGDARTIGAVVYNRACLSARRGERDQALHHLTLALELVPAYKRTAADDGELDALRDLAAFQALIR